MVEYFNSTDVLFYVAAREAKKAFGLKPVTGSSLPAA